jgi:aspartyl-tRNA(Asn)/glutamyl-tRNA(Gln) amidotransferase subunit B
MSSFSMISKAIAYEYDRQSALLDAGEKIDQCTRRRNDSAGQTELMRSKEDALDYRYMPDPDLPTLQLDPNANVPDIVIPAQLIQQYVDL